MTRKSNYELITSQFLINTTTIATIIVTNKMGF